MLYELLKRAERADENRPKLSGLDNLAHGVDGALRLLGRFDPYREKWLDYVAKCAILDNGAPPSC